MIVPKFKHNKLFRDVCTCKLDRQKQSVLISAKSQFRVEEQQRSLLACFDAGRTSDDTSALTHCHGSIPAGDGFIIIPQIFK